MVASPAVVAIADTVRCAHRCRAVARYALAAALIAALSWPTGSVRANTPRPVRELTWHAPPGCPSATEVLALLSKVEHDTRALSVVGTIQRQSEQYTLELQVEGEARRFERSLRAPDCRLLAESAVWLIDLAAIQLAGRTASARRATPQPTTVTEGVRESIGTPASQPAPAAAEMQDPVPRSAAQQSASESAVYVDRSPPSITHERQSLAADSDDDRAAPLALAVGAGVGVAGLGLTGAAPELSLSVELRRGALLAGLRVGTVLHPALELAESARLSFQSAYVALTACHDYRHGQLRTGPCAVLGGWLTVVGQQGLREARPQTALWVNAGGAWHLLVELHRNVQVSAEVGLTVGLDARPSLAVSGVSVAQVAPVAGYGRIGYGIALW